MSAYYFLANRVDATVLLASRPVFSSSWRVFEPLLLLDTGREAYKTASYPIGLEVVREPSLTNCYLCQGLEFVLEKRLELSRFQTPATLKNKSNNSLPAFEILDNC